MIYHFKSTIPPVASGKATAPPPPVNKTPVGTTVYKLHLVNVTVLIAPPLTVHSAVALLLPISVPAVNVIVGADVYPAPGVIAPNLNEEAIVAVAVAPTNPYGLPPPVIV